MKKSLISAIKKLLAKLGAEEVDGNNLVEVIDNGADMIEGGGSGGGAEPVFVTVTMTDEDSGTWSGATWDELLNAFGHNVAGIIVGDICTIWLNVKLQEPSGMSLCANIGPATYYILQNGTVQLATAN